MSDAGSDVPAAIARSSDPQLRSARARRDERVVVAVSLDVDELLMPVLLFVELPLLVALLPVVPLPIGAVVPLLSVPPPVVEPVLPVVLLPVVPLPIELLPVEPVPVVDDPVVPPVAEPLERVVLLPVVPVVLEPVELVEPAFGPEVDVLLLGEPEAPPWPPPVEPWARAPPHASAAAAERARILKVFVMR